MSTKTPIEFNGTTMTIAEWADNLGIKADSLYKRINIYGWSLDKALSKPINKYNKTAIKTRHGMYGTKIYMVWLNMKQRCGNPNVKSYKNYGGRGVRVCDRWNSFYNFYKDMGDMPDGFTIERIDNEKGYSPNNCKWASMQEQSHNKRNNRKIEFNGVVMDLSEWTEKLGFGRTTIRTRLDTLKWSIEKALLTPEFKNRRGDVFKYNGKEMTMVEWAKKYNIIPDTLLKRMNKYGWSLEKSLNTPVKKYNYNKA